MRAGGEGEEQASRTPAYALMAVLLGVFKTISVFRKVGAECVCPP